MFTINSSPHTSGVLPDAKKILHHVRAAHRIHLPYPRAVRHAHALQDSLGAERVHVLAIDDRRRPRPVVVSQHVLVVGRMIARPNLRARLGVDT